jgi:V8-like Glu-specific endopeptidase
MGVYEKTNNKIGEKRENQQKIIGSDIKETNIYLNKVSRSLCKITVKNIRGTGFLIKINTNTNNAKFFLMTNEHVIKNELIERNEIITFYYDNGFQFRTIRLDNKERIIIEFKKISLDIIIVQILQKDNINEDYFLLPSLKYNNIKIGDKIYIPQYPNNLNVSEGKIIDINNYELSYNASTELGASGSPILLDNTIEVIGIHKQGSEDKNYGDFIFPILNLFNKVKNENKVKNNDEYYIGELKNGLRHGKGKLYYKNGKLKLEGNFVNDKLEGFGKLFMKQVLLILEK